MKKSYKKFLCESLEYYARKAMDYDNFDQLCEDIFPLIINLIRREIAREKVEQKNKN